MSDIKSDFTNGHGPKEGHMAVAAIGHSLEEISGKVVESANDLASNALSTIKKYPLHTALAAGAVGFIVGAMFSRK